CSILEAVILSITPSYIAMMENKHPHTGQILSELKDDIDQPLSAILSLNTIAHTAGAAGVGAQAQIVFGEVYVTVITIILTLLILVLSEIIPKTLGARYWRTLAGIAGRVLKILIIILSPFVLLSRLITNLMAKEGDRQSFSREEFTAMAELGTEEGIFQEKESRIFKNLIRFRQLRARDIMTPRTVVVAFPEEMTVREVFEQRDELRVSRIPVFESNRDNITGYVLKNDLLVRMAKDETDRPLRDFRRDVLILPDLLKLADLFERLLEKQEHIAVLVDEYGGLSGIVTMEDVVETLLGMEIIDEADNIRDMQVLARQRWQDRAKRLGLVEKDEEISLEDLESR
ncbi:MAG TPA: CNNM domain-containing protein, partial [bacterium]|nr:CNNM domain-containing protein [bacterium]